MYQKFLPKGSIGVQVLNRKAVNVFKDSRGAALDNTFVEGHTLVSPGLDEVDPRVENHTLIID